MTTIMVDPATNEPPDDVNPTTAELVPKAVPLMESKYKMRYLAEDGSEMSKEAYGDAVTSGQTVYRAAFLGCTYHCG
jgi:hypothetical protein